MRTMDAEEIMPLMFSDKAEDLAQGISFATGKKFVAFSNGIPVACWGAILTKPQFYSVWMFSTNRWPEVALSVTRHVRKELMPALIETGAVRAECWSMDGHTVAHRWLEILGARREATVSDYGPARKPFHCYSWTKTRLEKDGGF